MEGQIKWNESVTTTVSSMSSTSLLVWLTSTTTSNTSVDSVDDNSDSNVYNWSFICVMVFVVAGTVGNVLVCLAVWLERPLQNVTNWFLVSLAFADLIVSTIVMPFGATAGFLGKYGHPFMCLLQGFSFFCRPNRPKENDEPPHTALYLKYQIDLIRNWYTLRCGPPPTRTGRKHCQEPICMYILLGTGWPSWLVQPFQSFRGFECQQPQVAHMNTNKRKEKNGTCISLTTFCFLALGCWPARIYKKRL